MSRLTLGLDVGTNSIGHCLIKVDDNGMHSLLHLGSRIIPMDGSDSDFKKGLPQTRNADRRLKKGARVGNKRYKIRRNKLVYLLQELDLLPDQIGLSQPFSDPEKLQQVNILPILDKTSQLTAQELYKLKVKAIHQPVSREEFGRILYHFNQLRGYAGGDDSEAPDDLDSILGIETTAFPSYETTIAEFEIISYSATREKSNKKDVYELVVNAGNGEEYSGTTTVQHLQPGSIIELKQVTRRNKKTGQVTSIEFSIPNKTGWRKKMESLEDRLERLSDERGRKVFLSEYFLQQLNENPQEKVRNQVVLRSRYLEEFDAIWETQSKAHLKEVSESQIDKLLQFLFPGPSDSQLKLRLEGKENGLKYIVKEQIIYYQRPLKSQDHLRGHCRFEKDEKTIAQSHPLFQEYRIWEQINKLSVNRRTLVGTDKKGKSKYQYKERPVSAELKEFLYDKLQVTKELSFAAVFKKLKEIDEFEEGRDFFNGLSTKSKMVGNSTRQTLKNRLGKFWTYLKLEDDRHLTELWQILYEVPGNEYDLHSERNQQLAAYLTRRGIRSGVKDFDKVVIAISSIKFPKNYQSISLGAIEKVIPLIRGGKYFDQEMISSTIRERIVKLLHEQPEDAYERSLSEYLERNESQVLTEGGFINAYALMLVYGKHTAEEVGDDELLSDYHEIKPLKRHSLRNPLVEQMINETLMVVKDIWQAYGPLTEIKVELAREMKNSKKERERIEERNRLNRRINDKLKARLVEMGAELTSTNLEKLKLWEEQRQKDPYTGLPIKQTDLFNKALYDVDHIIPQSRYFDDSLSNKVISSRKVNQHKGNRTSMEYFEFGGYRKEWDKDVFMEHVVETFYGAKRRNLLAVKLPENPVNRQKKETQYIAVRVKEELAKIVGSRNVHTSAGGVTHHLRNHWGITDRFKDLMLERFLSFYRLKARLEFEKILPANVSKGANVPDLQDPLQVAKAKQILKDLASQNLPEKQEKALLESLNKIDQNFSYVNFIELYQQCHVFKKGTQQIIKGYSKRLDHRAHAMDAFVVGTTEASAVKRLNDLNKHLVDWLREMKEKEEFEFLSDSEDLLQDFLSQESDIRNKALQQIKRFRHIKEPWSGCQQDLHIALNQLIVSHKPKDSLLIQQKEETSDDGGLIKTAEKIVKIRGALHEETIYGLSSGKESYRIPLSKFAGNQFDTAGNIEKIIDPFLRTIIRTHFQDVYDKNKAEAFGNEGLTILNKRLQEGRIIIDGYQPTKPRTPVYSVKIYRKKLKDKGEYSITLQKLEREKSYNSSMYVNTGSNYLFGVLEYEGKRIYQVLTLFDAAELLKVALLNNPSLVNADKKKVFRNYFEENRQAKVLFMLRKRDMVYLPEPEEEIDWDAEETLFSDYWKEPARVKGIYTVTKFSGTEIYFNHHTTAEVIEKKVELGSQNMLQTLEGRKIVQHCYPLKLDRLGRITEVNGRSLEDT